MKWRLIGPEKHDGFTNLALEEACIESVGAGVAQPTIRFYEWRNSAVVLGYFQKIHDEIDVNACRKHNIDMIRRITGGGAMYLDTHGEITFSVISPEKMLPGINESYKEVCGWLIKGLQNLGLSSEFRPVNDVTLGGKKISGSAMTRRHGAVMVHGTLLYDVDIEKMFTFLTPSGKKLSDKEIKSVNDSVTCIKRHIDIKKHELIDVIINAFMHGKEYIKKEWTGKELEHAAELVKNKYTKEEWIFRR